MNPIIIYIFYVAIFRLSVITAGIISIILGYNLFIKGIWSNQADNSNIEGKFGTSKVTVKNAAPGTVFAVFGAGLISIMLIFDSPQLSYNMIGKNENLLSSSETASQTNLVLRGESSSLSNIEVLNSRGVDFEKNNRTEDAAQEYSKALSIISEPMNNLAWLYYKKGDIDNAAQLSEIAVRISPNNADFIHTLAKIRTESGNKKEAQILLERAAKINPKYISELSRIPQSESKEVR